MYEEMLISNPSETKHTLVKKSLQRRLRLSHTHNTIIIRIIIF